MSKCEVWQWLAFLWRQVRMTLLMLGFLTNWLMSLYTEDSLCFFLPNKLLGFETLSCAGDLLEGG